MLVHQLDLRSALEQQAELVECRDSPLEHDPVHQEQAHALVLARRSGKELVLERRFGFVMAIGGGGFEPARTMDRRNGRDRMFVDQLGGAIPAQLDGERIEGGDYALQLDALDEEDCNRRLRPPNAVEKQFLKARLSRGYDCFSYSSPSRFSPIPKALSLRCSAERSIPMNVAVREMLPEKRRI